MKNKAESLHLPRRAASGIGCETFYVGLRLSYFKVQQFQEFLSALDGLKRTGFHLFAFLHTNISKRCKNSIWQTILVPRSEVFLEANRSTGAGIPFPTFRSR